MIIHYIHRYLLRTLGMLCLMLSLGTGQRGYAQNTEQEQLAKLRTFKKEFIAFALLSEFANESAGFSEKEIDMAMEVFFSAATNPSRNDYEKAVVTLAVTEMDYVTSNLPDKQLCLMTYKKALRSPTTYSSNPYDLMTQESEYRGAEYAMDYLGFKLLFYRIVRSHRISRKIAPFYGMAKWGINVPRFINDFEQRYGQSISELEKYKQFGYTVGVFAHDLMRYFQSKGIAIAPRDMRVVYAKLRPIWYDDEALKTYFNSIKPNLDKEEAFNLVLKPEGFVQQVEQSYRRNVATPLGI